METRCTTCNGTKHLLKLGGIYGECNACKGSGFVKAVKEVVKEAKSEVKKDDDYVLGRDEPVVLHRVDKRTKAYKSKLIAR